ncbi:MAG: U32 family peptidase [Clostridiales bacterium]|jgi:putative protease|nr:U32 family peptidase [Clostridiales bacterium]
MYELLSPAGDLEKLKTAFLFGADAVYCGGPSLQLRAQSAGMPMEDLEYGIEYAHKMGKRVYVTVNSFAHNGDFAELPGYLRDLRSIGADGIIVSDLGVVALAARTVPELPIHVSTQANCLNYESANVYHKMGAKRIVLGRELSLEEIREIRDRTPPELELEAFVHGAMCMAYSGRCLISAFLTGRDANRGDCAQACRWKYRLVEEKRPGEYFPIAQEEGGTTILSSKDLKTLSFIDRIKDAGITSFKIEGRMKSAYYVATVTNAYRHAIDKTAPIEILEREVRSVSHRDFSSGFYFGELKDAPASGEHYTQDCEFIAVVISRRGNIIQVEQRNRFFKGDELEVLSPNSLGESFVVTGMRDEAGNEVTSAPHPQQKLYLECPLNLSPGDILRRRRRN